MKPAFNPLSLTRFVEAQSRDYPRALAELKAGRKETHWIWYVFPQVAGLESSAMAQKYAIQSGLEAEAYVSHAVLGPRLRECAAAVLLHADKSIRDIMGSPDDLKLQSSMTLFAIIAPEIPVFKQVLEVFYAGKMDARTTAFLLTRIGRKETQTAQKGGGGI